MALEQALKSMLRTMSGTLSRKRRLGAWIRFPPSLPGRKVPPRRSADRPTHKALGQATKMVNYIAMASNPIAMVIAIGLYRQTDTFRRCWLSGCSSTVQPRQWRPSSSATSSCNWSKRAIAISHFAPRKQQVPQSS